MMQNHQDMKSNNKHLKLINFFKSLPKQLDKELKKFKNFNVKNKGKKSFDPVTNVDKSLERFIRQKISSIFPDHNIFGEEMRDKKTTSDFTWVIDPIDGTRSFVIGNPTWSNLISLNYKGKPILGLANFPVLKKYYINYSNKSAYVIDNGKKTRILVNKKVKFNNAKLSAAFHGALSLNQQKKIPQILKLMQFPCSDALSYSHLAEGRVDIVIQCSNKIWDIHPLIPIIKAAGGYISTWDNRDAINAGNILVSSNKTIHSKFLKLLKPVSK